jgi:large subunit ribosomal protein L24
MKLKVGDKVKVTAGKDRNREGKIKKSLPHLNKVLIEGVNKYKKHLKAQGEGKPGGIIDIEKPLSIANVALICPSCKQQTRVGFKINAQGKKERICRKCKASI